MVVSLPNPVSHFVGSVYLWLSLHVHVCSPNLMVVSHTRTCIYVCTDQTYGLAFIISLICVCKFAAVIAYVGSCGI